MEPSDAGSGSGGTSGYTDGSGSYTDGGGSSGAGGSTGGSGGGGSIADAADWTHPPDDAALQQCVGGSATDWIFCACSMCYEQAVACWSDGSTNGCDYLDRAFNKCVAAIPTGDAGDGGDGSYQACVDECRSKGNALFNAYFDCTSAMPKLPDGSVDLSRCR
jgi:hypothetical protein